MKSSLAKFLQDVRSLPFFDKVCTLLQSCTSKRRSFVVFASQTACWSHLGQPGVFCEFFSGDFGQPTNEHIPAPKDRLVPIASISSIKTMDGAFSRAKRNTSRTIRGPSPKYFCTNSDPTIPSEKPRKCTLKNYTTNIDRKRKGKGMTSTTKVNDSQVRSSPATISEFSP